MSLSYQDDLISARDVLALDRMGRPVCGDSQAIFSIMHTLQRSPEPEIFDELVTRGFLAGAPERYDRYIAPDMRAISAVRYEMGTSRNEQRHFCGESPQHEVELSPFAASAYAVTNSLYATFDARLDNMPRAARANPVTMVTWFDAAVFASWVGCRLPTEAEWEYLCGAGNPTQWCCADEHNLAAYAWYSENAEDRTHRVGTRMPNILGMYDMHGNVWEWCSDDYNADYYKLAPRCDPRNDHSPGDGTLSVNCHKVSRGGGYYALAEMCRTRYRLHDPAFYRACDLGFRLVRSTRT